MIEIHQLLGLEIEVRKNHNTPHYSHTSSFHSLFLSKGLLSKLDQSQWLLQSHVQVCQGSTSLRLRHKNIATQRADESAYLNLNAQLRDCGSALQNEAVLVVLFPCALSFCHLLDFRSCTSMLGGIVCTALIRTGLR